MVRWIFWSVLRRRFGDGISFRHYFASILLSHLHELLNQPHIPTLTPTPRPLVYTTISFTSFMYQTLKTHPPKPSPASHGARKTPYSASRSQEGRAITSGKQRGVEHLLWEWANEIEITTLDYPSIIFATTFLYILIPFFLNLLSRNREWGGVWDTMDRLVVIV